MFEIQRIASAERLQEVRLLHQVIAAMESPAPLQPDSDRVLVLRGLFFVHLYGYFESAVNSLVNTTLIAISDVRVSLCHLAYPVYTIALDSHLTSIGNTPGRGKWKKRSQLFEKQCSTTPCVIDDSALALYLQNISVPSLEQVFSCFGISRSVVPTNAHTGYVNELRENRNSVAHGRESSVVVGKRHRSNELLIRIDRIHEVVVHLQNVLQEYFQSKNFIAADYRAKYSVA